MNKSSGELSKRDMVKERLSLVTRILFAAIALPLLIILLAVVGMLYLPVHLITQWDNRQLLKSKPTELLERELLELELMLQKFQCPANKKYILKRSRPIIQEIQRRAKTSLSSRGM